MFIIEGIKSIVEFIQSSYRVHSIYYLTSHQSLLPQLPANIKLFEVNNAELDKISTLQTPQGVLALVYMKDERPLPLQDLKDTFSLVLDGVQDPGNLGTIIRTADWFGFKNIICSADTVETYNPKTVQATMGSLCRINVSYVDLPKWLKNVDMPVYGAMLEGENLYQVSWKKEGLLILGNEGQGVSEEIKQMIGKPVTIPRIGGAESLNVAVSAAIICSEVSRKLNK